MLILTAKLSDGPIWIIDQDGNELGTVKLLGMKGSQARLGFSFQDDINIYRDIVFNRIQREKEDG
tara:strand:- start:260 stop:454 length:195 start_codon:yes stop_codon:yes gene_type:complete